jgi:ABC-type sugar transport system ATPase subunit
VMRMADRILVVADGRLTARFARGEATQEVIMAAASLRPQRAAA